MVVAARQWAVAATVVGVMGMAVMGMAAGQWAAAATGAAVMDAAAMVARRAWSG